MYINDGGWSVVSFSCNTFIVFDIMVILDSWNDLESANKNLSVFAEGLCVCIKVHLWQAADSSALAFTTSLYRASKSTRGESLGSSQVFTEHIYMQHGHVCVFLDPEECVGAFQRCYSPKHLIPQTFLTIFLFNLLFFFPNCYPLPQAAVTKTCSCVCSGQMFTGSSFSTG